MKHIFDLSGKVAAVIGGASGIGEAVTIGTFQASPGSHMWQVVSEAFRKRVEPLAAELGARIAGHCDVTDMESLDAVFAEVGKMWDRLDFVVHAIAFSDKDELTGRYVETTALAENYTRYLDGLNGARRLEEIRLFHSLEYLAKKEHILALCDRRS